MGDAEDRGRWAEFRREVHRARLWRGIRSALGIAAIIALAIGMMLFLSSRIG